MATATFTATQSASTNVFELPLNLKPEPIQDLLDRLETILIKHINCKDWLGRRIHEWGVQAIDEFEKLDSEQTSEIPMAIAAAKQVKKLATEVLVDPFWRMPLKDTLEELDPVTDDTNLTWVWSTEVFNDCAACADGTTFAGKSPFSQKDLQVLQQGNSFANEILSWIESVQKSLKTILGSNNENEQKETKENHSDIMAMVKRTFGNSGDQDSKAVKTFRYQLIYHSRAQDLRKLEITLLQTDETRKAREAMKQQAKMTDEELAKLNESLKKQNEENIKNLKSKFSKFRLAMNMRYKLSKDKNAHLSKELKKTEDRVDVLEQDKKVLQERTRVLEVSNANLRTTLNNIQSQGGSSCVIL